MPYSTPLPQQSDLQSEAGYPNGLPKHPNLRLLPVTERSLSTTSTFVLTIAEPSMAAMKAYADGIAHNVRIPLEARQLIWGLSQSEARQHQLVDATAQVQEEKAEEPAWDDRVCEAREADVEAIYRATWGKVYALKTYWCLEELAVAGPYLPPYVHLNGLVVPWASRAKQLQADLEAGGPDAALAHLAELLLDPTALGGDAEPLEVEFQESSEALVTECQLLARLEQPSLWVEGLSVLQQVGSRYATALPQPPWWVRATQWLRGLGAFFRGL